MLIDIDRPSTQTKRTDKLVASVIIFSVFSVSQFLIDIDMPSTQTKRTNTLVASVIIFSVLSVFEVQDTGMLRTITSIGIDQVSVYTNVIQETCRCLLHIDRCRPRLNLQWHLWHLGGSMWLIKRRWHLGISGFSFRDVSNYSWWSIYMWNMYRVSPLALFFQFFENVK